MQTQTATKTDPIGPPIAQRIETARAMLAKLQVAADDAEAEAKRWQTTFERDPTEQAALAKEVAKQRAVNASVAAVTHERELDVLIDQQRHQARAVLAAECNDSMARVLAEFKAAEDQIAAGIAAYASAVTKLGAQHGQRVAAQQAGATLSPVSLERSIVASTHNRFEPLRAPYAPGQLTRNAFARFVAAGPDTRVVFEFVIPAQIPSPLL